MLKRLLVGVPLAGSLVFTVAYLRKFSIHIADAVILLFMLIGLIETVKAFEKMNIKVIKLGVIIPNLVTYPIMLALSLTDKKQYADSAILIGLVLCVLTTLITFTLKHKYTLNDAISTIFVSIYPGLLFTFYVAINHYYGGAIGIFLVLFISVLVDTMAYFFGVTIKGKKLIPSVSPKKTIAGFVGGLVGAILASCIVFMLFDYFNVMTYLTDPVGESVSLFSFENKLLALPIYIVIGLFGGFFAQLGDLSASWIKRKAGIKDFGSFFPGHGGFMDRIDSFLFIIPYIYIIMKIIYLCK